ncbi:MAG: hypothetical protein ACREOO_28905 [bacterium]
MTDMKELTLAGLRIMRGRIIAIDDDGGIMVEGDSEALPLSCEFLRTSAGPLPGLNPGDAVLYALDEIATRGYVLGVIQKYRKNAQGANGSLALPDPQQDFREIKFNAKEKIELRCGQSVLLMNKDGKIVLKGTSITSRASGPQKIKGATVQIN